MRHTNTICCLAGGYTLRKTASSEEITEYLFSSGFDGKINIWEISEKKQMQQSSNLRAMIIPQLRLSFFASKNQTKEVFIKKSNSFSNNFFFKEIGNEILCLIFDEKNFRIIAGGNSSYIYVFGIFNSEPFAIMQGHSDSVTCFAIDGNYLFSGSDDKTIRVWELNQCYSLYLIDSTHEDGIKDLILIEETGNLVTCAFDGKIHVWDYKEKKKEKVKYRMIFNNQMINF